MLESMLSMIDSNAMKNRFEELYYSRRNMVYNMAYSILHDVQLSEDVVMESFFLLAANMNKIADKTPEQISNYIFIIARNQAFKIYNSRKNIDINEFDDESLPDIQNVEIEIEKKEMQQKLFSMIKNMDFKYSDVLLLKYFYGMENPEIAKALGIGVNNVSQRIVRAKKQIRNMMSEEF